MLWIRYKGLTAGGYMNPITPTDFGGVENDIRTTRTPRLGRDGTIAGSDYVSKRTWTITMHTLLDTEDEAVALAGEWEKAVLDPASRTGHQLSVLEYSRDGRTWYRAYGRPSDFSGTDLGDYTREGASPVVLQFEQLRPWHFSSSESSTRISSAPAQGSAGWVAPFVFPLVSGGLGGPELGSVTNSGDRPAPLTVTFGGQVTEPRVRNLTTGAVVGVRGSLAWDERVTVDAMAETVELWRRDAPGIRRSVPGRLIRATRISKMTVPPGQSPFEFRSETASNAFVELSAPSAYTSLQ